MKMDAALKNKRLLPELLHFLAAKYFFNQRFQHLLIALTVPIVDSEGQKTGTA